MDTPNLKLIKDINDPPSPKMKRKFMELTKKNFEPDIRVKGGAGLAIATVVNVLNATEHSGHKADAGAVFLPAECFCAKFSEATGRGLMSSLVDKKYEVGYQVCMLGRAAGSFSRVAQSTKRVAKHLRVSGVKRTATSFQAPKLPELVQVKRNWIGRK